MTNDIIPEPEPGDALPVKRKKGFQKNDPRINRNGRPKAFDDLRRLAKELAWEYVTDAKGVPVLFQGRFVTRIELIMRQWAQSENPHLQQAFVKAAFGDAPAQVEVTGKDGGEIPIRIVDYRHGITALTSGSDEDRDAPGEN